MNNGCKQQEHLLDLIDTVYEAKDDHDMARSVFMALRQIFSFSSGVFMPVDPHTLELQSGLCFDCDPKGMAAYLAHYAPLDPYVRRPPHLILLNQTARFSDVANAAELARSEFSEFMHGIYYHALGFVAGVAGQPVAAFSVHRQRHQRDFGRDEIAIINRIAPHLARAIFLRQQASDPAQREQTGILMFAAGENALYLNGPARRFLGATPPEAVLAALPPQGAGVIRLTTQHNTTQRNAIGSAGCRPWRQVCSPRLPWEKRSPPHRIHFRTREPTRGCWNAGLRRYDRTRGRSSFYCNRSANGPISADGWRITTCRRASLKSPSVCWADFPMVISPANSISVNKQSRTIFRTFIGT